jgi:hypothetical protein
MTLKDFDWDPPGEIIGYVRRAERVLDLAILVHASGLDQIEQDCLRVVNPGKVLITR